MRTGLSLTITAAALALAACGGSSDGDDQAKAAAAATAASAATPVATASAKGPKVKVIQSDYGRILSNGRGRALYLFTADSGRKSECYGDCATAWPPYIVKSKPVAVQGAKPGLIGTTRRSDGRLQATYAGHPVYYYVGDTSPGEVLCQAVFEYGGYWYVLRSNGKAVTSS
jgi:predicted lipoprotein with Yx(FWY)xxD motif